MPLTKSAIKRVKQDNARHKRLVPYKTIMKTMMKKFADAVKEGKKDEAIALMPQVYKSIDMAAKKKIIHVNTAARKKSLVARLVAAK
ncbi:30S ribosomal protein S20 [Candidatus Peribacteria bacterium]|nr:MAG: 30S ribosomal protein S20 [Candidatus Peribacteria bacterium]